MVQSKKWTSGAMKIMLQTLPRVDMIQKITFIMQDNKNMSMGELPNMAH